MGPRPSEQLLIECGGVCVAWRCLRLAWTASASEYHGRVMYGGVPVPGATVTVTEGTKQLSTVTDGQGVYEFPDLADGVVEDTDCDERLFDAREPRYGGVECCAGGVGYSAAELGKRCWLKRSRWRLRQWCCCLGHLREPKQEKKAEAEPQSAPEAAEPPTG